MKAKIKAKITKPSGETLNENWCNFTIEGLLDEIQNDWFHYEDDRGNDHFDFVINGKIVAVINVAHPQSSWVRFPWNIDTTRIPNATKEDVERIFRLRAFQ